MCSCGRGLARACLSCVPWSIPSGRPAESRQRRQAFAQRRGDRDSGRARRGFSRPPSGLKWPRGVSSFMTHHQRAPTRTSSGVGKTYHPSVVQRRAPGKQRHMFNFAFSRPSSKIARMSSPGFRWCVRELVRAALCTVSSQTNACRALLVISETAIPVALVMDFRALQVASNGLGWPTVFHSFGLGATVSGAFGCISTPDLVDIVRPDHTTAL